MSIIEDKLKQLAEDPTAIQAITAIFNARVEKEKPVAKESEDNELLGQKFRAYEVAKTIVEETLKDIENYKSRPESDEGFDKSQ